MRRTVLVFLSVGCTSDPTVNAPLPITEDAAVVMDAAALPDDATAPIDAPARLDIVRWLAEHHVARPFRETDCTDAIVGSPAAPGLICGTRHRVTLYRLEGRRLLTAWKLVVHPWVEMTASTRDDGATLEVSDRPGSCHGALCESWEKMESQVQPHAWHESIARTCAARGTYTWKRNRYVQTAPAAPVSTKCPNSLLFGAE